MDISLSEIVEGAINVYIFIIIARIILELLRVNPYQPIVRFIYEITQPVLGFFRRYVPPVGMLDFSPLVAVLALNILNSILSTIFRQLGI